ncbi:Uncharacterized protein HA466_0120970 [Hirschfeldia incana]|nr:Uncharacterized protein HA466_0120970 [Hirschfeldia incana]
MPYYTKDDADVDDFDEYDPTPYSGGYDITVTYGRSLPPSDENCYPLSSRSGDAFEYQRPIFSSSHEPSAYDDQALNTEYSSYARPKTKHGSRYSGRKENEGDYKKASRNDNDDDKKESQGHKKYSGKDTDDEKSKTKEKKKDKKKDDDDYEKKKDKKKDDDNYEKKKDKDKNQYKDHHDDDYDEKKKKKDNRDDYDEKKKKKDHRDDYDEKKKKKDYNDSDDEKNKKKKDHYKHNKGHREYDD